MYIHTGTVGNCIEKLFYHLSIHISDFFSCEIHVKAKIRSSRQIYCTKNKGIIHRKHKRTESFDSFLISQSFGYCLTENYSGILDCMMRIDNNITDCLYIKIKETMSCKAVKHMVKKTYPRINICTAVSVNIKRKFNVCFTCFTLYCGCSF